MTLHFGSLSSHVRFRHYLTSPLWFGSVRFLHDFVLLLSVWHGLGQHWSSNVFKLNRTIKWKQCDGTEKILHNMINQGSGPAWIKPKTNATINLKHNPPFVQSGRSLRLWHRKYLQILRESKLSRERVNKEFNVNYCFLSSTYATKWTWQKIEPKKDELHFFKFKLHPP